MIWIPSLQLAAKVTHSYPGRQETTELLALLDKQDNITAISDQDLAGYQLIDFADVGDNETDPSMAWLKHSVAPGHEHHDHH